MTALDGEELLVRPGTSDLRNAVDHYRLGLFRPPQALDREPRQILELGSNMGASLTALAHRYPAAKVLGVEPDPGNAAIARRNVSRFGLRCRVVEAGVWDCDAELIVERGGVYGEHGFRLRPLGPEDPPCTATTTALSIDSILARHLPEGAIDYMQFSIEATEARVFAAGGDWVERVVSLRSEAHPNLGYPAERCRDDLEALGFRSWVDPRLPDKWVFALRP
jgi:FkbM family methyltransferase